MSRTWLHLSAPRFQRQDDDVADTARYALIQLVLDQRSKGAGPDLIVITGDLAATGAREEYARVTPFLVRLLAAAGLSERRERLVVVPGVHDGQPMAGTMTRAVPQISKEADEYFAPGQLRPHFMLQAEFRRWHDEFFAGLRTAPNDSTCSDVIDIDIDIGVRVAILPINTALFAHHPEHHGKLWIGRPPLRSAARALASTPASLRIAVMHHPPEWLGDGERSWATATLTESADVLLHGHVPEPRAEISKSAQASVLRVGTSPCAGSSRRRCVFYGSFANGSVQLRPFSYDDGSERWVLDTSVFPDAARENYVGTFSISSPPSTDTPPARGTVVRNTGPRHKLLPRRRERTYKPRQSRHVLSLRATRQGDRVTLSYAAHDEDDFTAPIVITGADAVIAEAQAWLRRPTPEKTAIVGERLGGLLFGDRSRPELQRVLRRLFGRPESAEEFIVGLSYAPVRCRIHTSAPELRSLPFSILAIDGYHLADDGWTFEVATPVPATELRPAIELACPCTTLLIAPRATARGHDPDAHLRDIDEFLERAWPLAHERRRIDIHRHVARSRAEIELHLQTHSPRVVYIFARIDANDERPRIRLDRGVGSEFVDLRELMKSIPDSSAVFINALGSRSQGLLRGKETLSGPACVIAPMATTAVDEAATIGLAWLEAVLRRGYAPVPGLDVVQRERSSARAAAMIAHTRYQSWRTTTAPSEDFVAKVPVSLDREAQRTLLFDRVRNLTASERRVLTVLAPAPADQQPDKLPQILFEHVHRKLNLEPIRIFHQPLQLPRPEADFVQALEEEFAEELLDPGESVEQGLVRDIQERRAQLGLRPSVRSVLWLEWQTHDPARTASSEVIDALLLFGSERLAPQCPGDLSLVSLVTIVSSEDGCDALVDYCGDELLTAIGARISSTSAGFVLLPRLGDVSRHDIDDYLFEHSSCPNDLVPSVGAAIFARTHGRYEQTVALLEELERTGSWSAIAATAPTPSNLPEKRKPKSFR